MGIKELLGKRIVFFDGGTGTLLQAKGLPPGAFPETWNITHPDEIIKLHEAYLQAGCDIIKTNTFGANRLKFPEDGEYSLNNIVEAAVECAKQAIKNCKKEKEALIALDLGPTGKLLKPLGDLAFEDCIHLYQEVIKIGAAAGADMVLIETMGDLYEIKAAILAVKENSSLPVFATMIFDERGKLLTGGTVAAAVSLLEGLRVDALGVNCGLGPVQMESIVSEILAIASIPVIVNPNAGLPREKDGITVFDVGAEEFAEVMKRIAEKGAWIVGGCCGTTPEYIKKVVERSQQVKPKPIIKKDITCVSSYARCVAITDDPIMIGERINPTGKAKLKQALREHNLDYILQEAVTQQDHGAQVLDVNVGLPEIDEKQMLCACVTELQSITDLPLQLDTTEVAAMEAALRCYNGKPLINSVNGKQESMDMIFPLAAKYGGVMVALTIDEQGIPETSQGRVAIAEKILAEAAKYGIEKKDLLIDALAMTVSTDDQSAQVTLEALAGIRRMGMKTVLGVSNVSFGLPKRETINAAFFLLALQKGLNAAIINPSAKAMREAYDAYRVLAGFDKQCASYVASYAGEKAVPVDTKQGAAISLGEAIKKGLKERAWEEAGRLAVSKQPLEIINEEMTPALDFVGKAFEQGTLFLPQLLMSAEAAKAAFEVLKEKMSASGQVQVKKEKIILATVKGDIHDIGKNIVKVLLENYSYDIIDLGKDVAPERIVETAICEQVKLVGLSALMTTTVSSMAETIKLLRKAMPHTHIMVGGAVMTKEYADQIGADRYCRDAMASVHYAEEILP